MADPKIIATVECRMTSTRLPGKVMLESCGQPMLAHIAQRLGRAPKIDQVVLATTTNAADDCIEALAKRLGVGCFRGSEDDVLARVLGAARTYHADIIVEITGDCPLIDPEVTAQTLDLYLFNDCDYASNDGQPAFPLGLNVEVFSTKLLELADREGLTEPDREHVSWFFVRQPQRFRLLTLPAPPSLYWPELRLTLDEPDDYRLIDKVFQALYPDNPCFTLRDVVLLLKSRPDWVALNAHVAQRTPEDAA
jgi:spore coat polysaccharide biosynthesis protein SpsF